MVLVGLDPPNGEPPTLALYLRPVLSIFVSVGWRLMREILSRHPLPGEVAYSI